MDATTAARLEQTAELFRAVGHPMRLAMLERLKAGPWCVCELADSLGLSKSVASKHLSLLHGLGVLSMERRGTQVIYTLTAPCIVDMSACCHQAVLRNRLDRLGAAAIPESP